MAFLLTDDQATSILDLLGKPITYRDDLEGLVSAAYFSVGQSILDKLDDIVTKVSDLEETSYTYAGDANSSLIQAETLKWSEGGRQGSINAKRGEYAIRVANLLGIPLDEIFQGGSYPGYTYFQNS